VLKDISPKELVALVKLVAAGEALLDPSVTLAVTEEFVRRAPVTPKPGTELDQLT
jgi:DNA-binding NarL/FixJ family response regulator